MKPTKMRLDFETKTNNFILKCQGYPTYVETRNWKFQIIKSEICYRLRPSPKFLKILKNPKLSKPLKFNISFIHLLNSSNICRKVSGPVLIFFIRTFFSWIPFVTQFCISRSLNYLNILKYPKFSSFLPPVLMKISLKRANFS